MQQKITEDQEEIKENERYVLKAFCQTALGSLTQGLMPIFNTCSPSSFFFFLYGIDKNTPIERAKASFCSQFSKAGMIDRKSVV